MDLRRESLATSWEETDPLISRESTYNSRKGKRQHESFSGTHTIGALCFLTTLAALVILWCITDQWNHTVSNALFTIGDVRMASIDTKAAQKGMMVFNTAKVFPNFTYPLTLAFLQFACMGLVFMAIYCLMFKDAAISWKDIYAVVHEDRRWLALVITHIFSIFWLQSLMMPAQALSLGLFAASRAIEIPVAAVLRVPCADAQIHRRTLQTTTFSFAAAVIIYFSYVQVSGCLCVWSGHGVSLAGPTFWIIYFLVLTLPATNAVLQEGVMKESRMHPVLMLGLQNTFAAMIFSPILLLANVTGWESIYSAVSMIVSYREVCLLVVWLCIQMALSSGITVGVIRMTNSFWAVSLRALRVVYWWLQQVFFFYAGAAVTQHASVSMANPEVSLWSFVMLCGLTIAACAIFSDLKADDATRMRKRRSSKFAFAGP